MFSLSIIRCGGCGEVRGRESTSYSAKVPAVSLTERESSSAISLLGHVSLLSRCHLNMEFEEAVTYHLRLKKISPEKQTNFTEISLFAEDVTIESLSD